MTRTKSIAMIPTSPSVLAPSLSVEPLKNPWTRPMTTARAETASAGMRNFKKRGYPPTQWDCSLAAFLNESLILKELASPGIGR